MTFARRSRNFPMSLNMKILPVSLAITTTFALSLLGAGCSSDEGGGPAGSAAGTVGVSGSTSMAGSSGSGGGSSGATSGGSSGMSGSAGAAAGSGSGSGGAAGATGGAGAAGSAGSAGSGGGSGAPSTEKFSFFVTSMASMVELAKAMDPTLMVGFGGDLSYGESGAGAGLRGADKICAAVAEKGMPGNNKRWRAFLSVTKGEDGQPVDAISRIGNGPWYDRLGVSWP
jgi:hypothetical protein